MLQNWDRRDTYAACLGRLPEVTVLSGELTYRSPADGAEHICAALLSEEFRRNAAELVGRALPNLARSFFVHIPRTGGTSIQRVLERSSGGVPWHDSYSHESWFFHELKRMKIDQLDFMLQFLASFAHPQARLFLCGHLPVSTLISRQIVRARDGVFAVIRNPVETVLSNIDYILQKSMGEMRTPDAMDWREWLATFEINSSTGVLPTQDQLDKWVHSPRFREEYGNTLVRYLSFDGSASTVSLGLRLLNVQLLRFEDGSASAYLREEFGITDALPRINVARSTARSMLKQETMAYIREVLCAEDMRVWHAALEKASPPESPS